MPILFFSRKSCRSFWNLSSFFLFSSLFCGCLSPSCPMLSPSFYLHGNFFPIYPFYTPQAFSSLSLACCHFLNAFHINDPAVYGINNIVLLFLLPTQQDRNLATALEINIFHYFLTTGNFCGLLLSFKAILIHCNWPNLHAMLVLKSAISKEKQRGQRGRAF